MTDTFISYSRRDIAFAKIVHESLQDNQLDTWIDWQDIPPSSDWFAEIKEAIEQADTFIFIISPFSVKSEICSREIAHAELNNKRLIPIVIGDIDTHEVPATLQQLNWIFFKEEDHQYAKAISDLMTAITLDQPWLKAHTRIQNRALEWERSGSEGGYLLHGGDLADAENWLAQASGKEPAPTTLQTQYILASRAQATRRQRRTLAGVGLGLVIAVLLGILAWSQRNVAVAESHMRATAQNEAMAEANMRATAQNAAIAEANMRATAQNEAEIAKVEAERQRDVALSRYLSDRSVSQLEENHWELALLLAVEAGRKADTYEAISALRNIFTARGRTLLMLEGHKGSINYLTWSPDKSKIATNSLEDKTIRIFDTMTGETLHIIETAGLFEIHWSPDGSRLLGSGTPGIRVWDIDTANLLFSVESETEKEIAYARWDMSGDSILSYFRTYDDENGYYPARFAQYDGFLGKQLLSTQEEMYVILREDFTNHAKTQLIAWKRIENGNPDQLISVDTFVPIVIDWQTGKQVMTFADTHAQISNLIWSPDDSKILIEKSGENIQVWGVYSGELVFETPVDSTVDVAFNPTGDRLLIAQCDQRRTSGTCIAASAHVWDIESGAEEVGFSGFPRKIDAAAWSPDGDSILTISYDPSVNDSMAQIWDTHTGIERLHFQGAGSSQVEWNAEGTVIMTRSLDEICLWDAVTGLSLVCLPVEPTSSADLSWDQSTGQILAAIGPNAHVFSIEPGGEVLTLSAHGEGVSTALWHPLKNEILTAGCEMMEGGDVCISGSLKIWDAATGNLLQEFIGHQGSVRAVWNQSGDRIISASSDDTLRMWDTNSGAELLQIVHPHTVTGVSGLSWSPDESKILTYVKDLFQNEDSVWIWDAVNGEMLVKISPVENLQDDLQVASWSPDGKRVLTYTSDMGFNGAGSRAQIWDASTGEEQLRLVFGQGNQAVGGEALWNPTGDFIFVHDTSSDIFGVWDVLNGTEIWSYQFPDSIVNSGAWSPDGNRVAVGLERDWLETQGRESVIQIYDSLTGDEIITLLGHTDHIRQLIWSKDDATIMSRSDDNTIRIWDVHTGEQVNQLIRNQGDLTSVDWSPDERYILTPSDDGTVRIWYTRLEDLQKAACEIAPRNMTEHEWQTYFSDEPYRQTCPK